MINNIDPTAPSGGRPNEDVKIPPCSPEKGYEAFYTEYDTLAEMLVEVSDCIFTIEDLFVSVRRETVTVIEEVRQVYKAGDAERAMILTHGLLSRLAFLHAARTGKCDFFAELLVRESEGNRTYITERVMDRTTPLAPIDAGVLFAFSMFSETSIQPMLELFTEIYERGDE